MLNEVHKVNREVSGNARIKLSEHISNYVSGLSKGILVNLCSTLLAEHYSRDWQNLIKQLQQLNKG